MFLVNRPCLSTVDGFGPLTFVTLRGPVDAATAVSAYAYARQDVAAGTVYFKFAASIPFRGAGATGFAVVRLQYGSNEAPGVGQLAPTGNGFLALRITHMGATEDVQIAVDFPN